MKEHTYIPKRSKAFQQSIFIWLFWALQIAINLMIVSSANQRHKVEVVILINILLGLINVPGTVLFLKYYRYSIGKKIIITYNTIKLIDENGRATELNHNDIVCVTLVENNSMSRLPWCDHEYFALSDSKGNQIIITSYFMGLHEFWLDSLTRKISNKTLIRKEKIYPLF